VDCISGAGRFTLGVPELFVGVSIIVITVGILALGEVFHVASRIHRDSVLTVNKRPYLSKAGFKEALPSLATRNRLRRTLRSRPRRRR
jgi:putative tricarboxylic transport membrane protein